jgi:hypothetical protein
MVLWNIVTLPVWFLSDFKHTRYNNELLAKGMTLFGALLIVIVGLFGGFQWYQVYQGETTIEIKWKSRKDAKGLV